MKRTIRYGLFAIFLLVIAYACMLAIAIPEQASLDSFQALHYPDHPSPRNALFTFLWAAAVFAIGYAGYFLLTKTRMPLLSFDTFYSLGFLVQAVFAVFLLVSVIDGNSRSLGVASIVLIALIAPLSVSKLYQLAK